MTIAKLLKPFGYATGLFGNNHLGDKDEFLFDQSWLRRILRHLYHLNAEEEPEDTDHPKDPAFGQHSDPEAFCTAGLMARINRRSTDTEAHGNDP